MPDYIEKKAKEYLVKYTKGFKKVTESYSDLFKARAHMVAYEELGYHKVHIQYVF